MKGTILFVDDEPNILRALRRTLGEEVELEVLTAEGGAAALEVLAQRQVDVVVADHGMPEMDGATFLAKVKERHPQVVRMMLTGLTDTATAVAAINRGEVRRFLNKPWESDVLRSTIREAIVERAEATQLEQLREAGIEDPALVDRARRIASKLDAPKPWGTILVELGLLAEETWEAAVQRRRARLPLAEILLDEGILSAAGHLAYVEARRTQPGKSDRQLLVESGAVHEEGFLKAVELKFGIPYVEVTAGEAEPKALASSSIPWLTRNRVLPLRADEGRVRVAMADPLDPALRAEVERTFGGKVEIASGASAKIIEALRTLERLREVPGASKNTTLQYRELDSDDPKDDAGEGAVQIVDYLLLRAIEAGASDLHIEPLDRKVRVRIRVDGVLQPLTELPGDFAARVVSRVKVLAGADISERRLHQDGRIFVKVQGREIDLRCSTYASMFGETIVLRLLDRRRGIVPLEKVGFEPLVHELVGNLVLRASSGLVLLTGPTGSGKTTTLYSFVGHLNEPGTKIITAEDPVEYVLEGVTQCNVNERTGPSFADSLRAMVRQDPDIIVVGEVRDETTAGLAVESALTGHKVLSTFHTEDSVGAIVRLLEMGVEPFLVASTLCAVVAQRLVRRICPECAEATEPDPADLRFLGLDHADVAPYGIHRGGGCGACNGSGFKGRLAIHEVLLPDEEFRGAILARAAARELRRLARSLEGFFTLQEDGVTKAIQGRTTLEEIVGSAPRDPGARKPAVLLAALDTGGRS